jgi:hypothetical protein
MSISSFGTEAGTIMKTLKRILVMSVLLCCSFAGSAQVQLTIDSLVGFPDSAMAGQSFPITTIVSNSGGTPFQGTLQIAIQSQTFGSPGAIDYLYFNNTPIIILAGDTVHLTSPNGYSFDTTFFRPGNNVVVVWPVSSQILQIDTAITSLYLITFSGIQEVGEHPIVLSPVPAREIIRVKTGSEIPIEHVRIYDCQGRSVPVRSGQEDNGFVIYLEGLPAGQYVLEAMFRNSVSTRARFIRLP